MFQFSDDIDEDILEDVFSISTNEVVQNNEINHQSHGFSHNFSRVDSNSDKSDSVITLKDCDDDDLILSAVDDVTDLELESQKSSTVSPSDRIVTTTHSEVVHQSQIAHSSKDIAPVIVTNTTKHKISDFSGTPTSIKYSKIEYERKFPGPAGLIAKKSKKDSFVSHEKLIPSDILPFESHQTGDSLFDSSPWQQSLYDMSSKSNQLLQTVKEFTISNVKRLNSVKHTSWKVPVFAAVIYNLDASVCNPTVTLRDPSGEIRGTLHKDLWEQYNHLLTVGSVLLLRHVSVVSMINSRKLYLNITTNNIISIYSAGTDDNPVAVTHLIAISEIDFLKQTKTDNNSKPNNSSSITISNSCSRSNADLLNLISNSNIIQSPTACSSPKIPSQRNVLSDFNSNSLLASECISSTTIEKPKFEIKTLSENDASLVLNELEGVDADSLFDDF